VSGKPLILHLTTTKKGMGYVLKQHDKSGREERAIYYLIKKFTNYKSRYTMVKKLYYVLVWDTK
jgi:hypothetical protein